MCLGIPMEIVVCEETSAIAEVDGVRREVSLILLPEPVEIGDYVLVHAGYALARIDVEQAEESLDLMRRAADGDFLTWGGRPEP